MGWTDIAGETRGQQLKTVFAAVGAAALMLHGLSWLGSRQPATPEKKPKKKKPSSSSTMMTMTTMMMTTMTMTTTIDVALIRCPHISAGYVKCTGTQRAVRLWPPAGVDRPGNGLVRGCVAADRRLERPHHVFGARLPCGRWPAPPARWHCVP